mmetsp:Transcript_119481/g.230500  ORF Transcript_119481/g.230500 Transcript_119481/m.230500 type:complete len:578 (-) Transcript_119481:19-1752(-)
MARSTALALMIGLVLASVGPAAEATVFLGRVPAHAGVSAEDLKFENGLLSQIEEVLGSEHRVFTEKRLEAIKHYLEPIVKALPKNEKGKLGHAAVSYALYRLFVQRHAWFVVGLEPFKSMSEWNSTSPVSVIDQRVPEYVAGLFHTRLGEHGFGLHELAVLAATLEHLVHKESLVRLSAAYKSLSFSKEDVLSKEEGDNVMDTYMSMYILGPLIRNISNVSMDWVRFLRSNVTELYPSFPETQQFLREVSETVAPSRDYLYYSDVANAVEEVGDRYGRWQDYECRALKDMLVDMEDKGTGGAGRVRLADFYRASLYEGKWQFMEGIEYLRELGALDDSNPDNLKVIIPNYINGPSNCVAGSSYYSVCCVNECEEILGHLEIKIAAPEATPTKIANIIAQLPSATIAGNRTLSPWLLRRLDEVAQHHAGLVPLHGRLFGQWLHYAYPRECPYPHTVGATFPRTAEQFVTQTRRDFSEPKDSMKRIIESPVPQQKSVDEAADIEEACHLESAMWTMEEELVIAHYSPPSSADGSLWTSFQPWLRGIAFAMAVVSAAFSLVRVMDLKLSTAPQGTEKYYV